VTSRRTDRRQLYLESGSILINAWRSQAISSDCAGLDLAASGTLHLSFDFCTIAKCLALLESNALIHSAKLSSRQNKLAAGTPS
jgi:hypothetical protein